MPYKRCTVIIHLFIHLFIYLLLIYLFIIYPFLGGGGGGGGNGLYNISQCIGVIYLP